MEGPTKFMKLADAALGKPSSECSHTELLQFFANALSIITEKLLTDEEVDLYASRLQTIRMQRDK